MKSNEKPFKNFLKTKLQTFQISSKTQHRLLNNILKTIEMCPQNCMEANEKLKKNVLKILQERCKNLQPITGDETVFSTFCGSQYG